MQPIHVTLTSMVNRLTQLAFYFLVSFSSILAEAQASTVLTLPATPESCGPMVIKYDPFEGPLAAASPVHLHVGRNEWQDVVNPDPAMSWDGSFWTYTYYPQPGTKVINCVFNDGSGTWDNNSGADWAIPLTGCLLPDQVSMTTGGSPSIVAPFGTNQNTIGESFVLTSKEGHVTTVEQGGFGSFGEIMLHADTNYLYLGGAQMDVQGSNHFEVLFIDVDTLPDDRLNLWAQSGLPNGLDKLHNLAFESPMDIAILLGDESGDETQSSFTLSDGSDMGQGLFYLSETSFTPVGGALLAQFDSQTTSSQDDDGNASTDYWMAAIPWASLNASGVDDIAVLKICGVLVSSTEQGNDRYLSSNFIGTIAQFPGGVDTNGNVGFNFMAVAPITIVPPSRITGELITNTVQLAAPDFGFLFNSSIGVRHRVYKGVHPSALSYYTSATSSPPSQAFTDLNAIVASERGIYAVKTQPEIVDLKLMCFNIRYGSADDGANNWTNRRAQVYALLNRESSDILTIQEAERFQLDEIHANVIGYSEVGEARNGGTSGEYSCILYKTELFNLLASDTFWLSSTPEVVGSISWGNAIPRICSWAKLQHKETGRTLFVFNTHLDHANQFSREQSIKLIVNRIATRDDITRPVLLTGDLNANEGNIVVQYLRDLQPLNGTTANQDGADLFDVFRARHPSATNAGTIHGFTGTTTSDKIDYIFHSEGVPHYDARILHDNENGSFPSDHFPVTSRFLLEE